MLQVEHPFCLQLADDLLSFAHHVTHRKLWIDIVYNPRKPILWVKLGMNL